MTETYFPFDSGNGAAINEDQWRILGAGWGTPGVVIGEGTELRVTAGAGLSVAVSDGRAFCRGHIYDNDSALNLTVAPNNGATTRIDSIVIDFDFSANAAAATALLGGVNPPALTRNYTSRYHVQRALVFVNPGAINLTNADILMINDEFAQPVGTLPTGALFDAVTASAPSGFIQPYGQVLLALQFPRLAAVMPPLTGAMTWGFIASSGGLPAALLLPDHRDRVAMGAADLGGVAASLLNGNDRIGDIGGSSTIAASDLPAHRHALTHTPHDHMLDVVQDDDGNWPVLIDNPFDTYGIDYGPLGGARTKPATFTRFAREDPVPDNTNNSTTPTAQNTRMPPYVVTNKLLKVC